MLGVRGQQLAGGVRHAAVAEVEQFEGARRRQERLYLGVCSEEGCGVEGMQEGEAGLGGPFPFLELARLAAATLSLRAGPQHSCCPHR